MLDDCWVMVSKYHIEIGAGASFLESEPAKICVRIFRFRIKGRIFLRSHNNTSDDKIVRGIIVPDVSS